MVVGISLLGVCRLRLRRYPHLVHRREETVELDLAPRSAYVLQGPARWQWQHHIPPTRTHRYSITFRTLAERKPARRPQAEPTI